jgi:hypothetical protein
VGLPHRTYQYPLTFLLQPSLDPGGNRIILGLSDLVRTQWSNNDKRGGKTMDVQDYCSGVRTELTAWKAKLYDLTRRAEKLDGDVKQKVLYNLQDFNMFITDMEDRIRQLETECPTEWSPVKKEIDNAHVNMRGKYEDTMDAIGTAAPVSVPG